MPSGWLIEPYAERPQPVTLGADKGYDASDFVVIEADFMLVDRRPAGLRQLRRNRSDQEIAGAHFLPVGVRQREARHGARPIG